MIDKNTATARAREHIKAMKPPKDDALVLQENLTIDEPFGWVFFYNSKKFIETSDYRYAILGNAPLIVDRHDGSVHDTGTARPIEHYIQEYKRKRGQTTHSARK